MKDRYDFHNVDTALCILQALERIRAESEIADVDKDKDSPLVEFCKRVGDDGVRNAALDWAPRFNDIWAELPKSIQYLHHFDSDIVPLIIGQIEFSGGFYHLPTVEESALEIRVRLIRGSGDE